MATGMANGLLRLLQVTDSSFPVGGFAYSHGLEWLAANERIGERELAGLVEAYVRQAGGGQWMPAALAALRARSLPALLRTDDALDASIAAAGEREAGRAMGERLLVAAQGAFGGERASAFLAAVRAGQAPGQYAAAYGCVAREADVEAANTLAALGFAMAASLTQAAVRLGLIGQAAATRLAAGAERAIAETVAAVLDRAPRPRFGAFTPRFDVAGALHPTLPFRMFAS